MVRDEDARSAARRIVQQVLAARDEPAAGGVRADDVRAGDVRAGDPRVHDLVDDAVEDLTGEVPRLAGGGGPATATASPEVTEARTRARELVAEVLAAHEAPRDASDRRGEAPAAAADASSPDAALGTGAPQAAAPIEPDSTARLRARELVAAVLAEAEARKEAEEAEAEAQRRAEAEAEAAKRREAEAARELAEALAEQAEREAAEREAREEAAARARAEEERRRAEEEQRRAEEEARARREAEEAERARREEHERLERERARARREAEEAERARREEHERQRREEQERALWADADRDVASETLPMRREDGDGPPPPRPEETTPLSVAELAAAGRPASDDGDEVDGAADARRDGEPDGPHGGGDERPRGDGDGHGRTVAIPVATGARSAEPDDDEAFWPQDRRPAAAADQGDDAHVVSNTVLEATVDPADYTEPARTGRWLVASLVGAVMLAILFPWAINALMQLVSLS